jgi:CRISPR/Cas system-associated exonuclease Cas4 (RecB family)
MCTSICAEITLPLTILGFCFGFYASVVIPSVPMVVKHNLVGTAFGLTGVFQNTALALFPMITGMIFN